MADRSLAVDTPGIMLGIDGTQMHYSDPFAGKRVSVVAFQHTSASGLDNQSKDQLKKLGFRSKLLKEVSSASSTHEPVQPIARGDEQSALGSGTVSAAAST